MAPMSKMSKTSKTSKEFRSGVVLQKSLQKTLGTLILCGTVGVTCIQVLFYVVFAAAL